MVEEVRVSVGDGSAMAIKHRVDRSPTGKR